MSLAKDLLSGESSALGTLESPESAEGAERPRTLLGSNLRVCARCIMDESDPDITFDSSGVCNHCIRYDRIRSHRVASATDREPQLLALVDEIKAAGKGRRYDCVIGVSGGVDSTYVASLVKDLGLRPLAVHFDNGWNSELAVANIEKVLRLLDIDLYTYVVDWEEFRDLQIAFLKSSTPDGEVPTDHAILALLYKTAAKHGLRHVLSGANVVTEGVLPESWAYGFLDWRYISSVHRRFGTRGIASFPRISLPRMAWYALVRRIRYVSILNFVDYRKSEAMELLQSKLGWVYYGGKHYESIYTRFYQAYYLPRKFGIDKRRAHYSALVCGGQMSRDEAVALMAQPSYPADLLRQDCQYVLKKLELNVAEFEAILSSENKSFNAYPNSLYWLTLAKGRVNRNRRMFG